jgi:hypothetical protein
LNETQQHDLHDFMSQITNEMESEYQRIRRRAPQDPGTAGDQGEQNWAELLKGWLPSGYCVVTKGRLIGYQDHTSPQVDVIILKPSYPRKLRSTKLYLAAGVAAAFECKTTLITSHIKEAVETAVVVKSLCTPRFGSPYQELRAPIIYGLLAHTHDWKSQGSDPLSNIDNKLRAEDEAIVTTHPRLGLDLLCVADVATWSAWVMSLDVLSNAGTPDPTQLLTSHAKYAGTTRTHPFTPIGAFIASLTQKLAWEDPICRDLALYYALVLQPSTTLQMRRWPAANVYSQQTLHGVAGGRCVGAPHPDLFHPWSILIK